MRNGGSIHKAACNGDIARVTELLSKRPSLVNAIGDLGYTPLFVAATVEVARQLVAYGGDVAARGGRYQTPLHAAAEDDRLDVARFLIEQGADVNAASDIGEGPLNSAQSAAMVQLLFDHGALLEGEYANALKPLHRAAANEHKEAAEQLIRLGANVDTFLPCWGTPLIQALRSRALDLAMVLLEAGAAVNVAEHREGMTPLHLAVECGKPEWAAWLTESETLTPSDLVRQLIVRGADLCARNIHGETPFHVAQRVKATDIVAVLGPYLALLDDPFPPLPGEPQSERLRIHPKRSEAVTILRYGGLALWSLDNPPRLLARVQTTLPHFRNLAMSPDGEQIAIAGAESVEVRRWGDLSLVSEFAFPNADGVGSLAFSPDGRWLAVNTDQAPEYEIEVETNVKCFQRHTEGNAYLIELSTGQVLHLVGDLGPAAWMSFGSAHLLASSGDIHGGRVCVHRIADDGQSAELVWNDAGMDDGDDSDDEESRYWKPHFLVHGAISPDGRWLAYFGTDEYAPSDCLGELVLHSLASGKVCWHRPLNLEAVGEGRLMPRDYFDSRNHTEVLFVNNTELVCGVTDGTLLFYDVATGTLTRRFYFDTDTDVLSLAFDCASSTLWAVLSNGQLASVCLFT